MSSEEGFAENPGAGLKSLCNATCATREGTNEKAPAGVRTIWGCESREDGPLPYLQEGAPVWEGQGGARAITPRPGAWAGKAPSGNWPAPGAGRKEGERGARLARQAPADSDGRRRVRRLASRGPVGGGIGSGAARSPPAARAPASRAVAAAAAAAAAAAPPRRLLHLCGGSSGSARRRHQQQHSETSLPSRDPTQS